MGFHTLYEIFVDNQIQVIKYIEYTPRREYTSHPMSARSRARFREPRRCGLPLSSSATRARKPVPTHTHTHSVHNHTHEVRARNPRGRCVYIRLRASEPPLHTFPSPPARAVASPRRAISSSGRLSPSIYVSLVCFRGTERKRETCDQRLRSIGRFSSASVTLLSLSLPLSLSLSLSLSSVRSGRRRKSIAAHFRAREEKRGTRASLAFLERGKRAPVPYLLYIRCSRISASLPPPPALLFSFTRSEKATLFLLALPSAPSCRYFFFFFQALALGSSSFSFSRARRNFCTLSRVVHIASPAFPVLFSLSLSCTFAMAACIFSSIFFVFSICWNLRRTLS